LGEKLFFYVSLNTLIRYIESSSLNNTRPVCLNNSRPMGRPKDFPNIYQDLLAKHKSKGIADKEYKELLPMARVRTTEQVAVLFAAVVVLTSRLCLLHLHRSKECQRRRGWVMLTPP
jgi:hypothetical protein